MDVNLFAPDPEDVGFILIKMELKAYY